MSQPANMNDRVTRLENEVAQVRYLAVAANRDTTNFQAVISGQTGVLNAIGETQREHSLTLASHTRSLARLNATVNHHSTVLDSHTEILDSHTEILGKLRVGQEHITTLLTRALDLPDQATESGE
jgi:hypothetical protein